jgi:hypothetical protein
MLGVVFPIAFNFLCAQKFQTSNDSISLCQGE